MWHYNAIWVSSGVSIGDNSQFNLGVFISGVLKIDKNVLISPSVKLIGGIHNYNDLNIPIRLQ